MATAMPVVRLLIGGVDETAYLRADLGVTIVHGRSDAESAVGPGRATLTLDNTSGRFTLGRPNAAGVTRVSGRSLAVDVWDDTKSAWSPRFVGTVDSWPAAWDVAGTASVTVSASDVLKRLALLCDGRTVGDAAAEYQRVRQMPGVTRVLWCSRSAPLPPASGDRRLWPTQEATPAWAYDEGWPSFDSGAVFGAAAADFAGASTPTATLSGVSDWVLVPSGGLGTAFGAVRMGAAWVRLDAMPDSLRVGDVGGLLWRLVSPGVLRAEVSGSGWTGATATVQVGRWHHLAISVDETTTPPTVTWWADGAPVCSTTTAAATGAVVLMDVGAESATSGTGAVTVAHQVQVGCSSDPTLIPAVVAALRGVGAGFTERTDERIERVLRRIGLWTAGALDVGRATMTPTTPGASVAAATAIQDAVAAEGGALFATVDGGLRFASATSRWGATAALTLTADQVGEDLRLDTDGESGVANAVIASNGSESVRLDDADSQATYGLREVALTAQAAGLALHQLASEMLARRRWEGLRVAQLTLDLLTQPDIRHDALGLELGSVVHVSSLPPGADATEVSAFVEGWTETIRADEWTLAINTSTGMLGAAATFGGAQFDSGRFGI